MIPVPVHMDQENFLCIDIGYSKSILCLDRARKIMLSLPDSPAMASH